MKAEYRAKPVKNSELEKVSHIVLHLQSRRIEYVFKDRDSIFRDYKDKSFECLRLQAWNLIYRYAKLTNKELEVFKVES